ncbi:MAG: nucleotidyl transferase [Tissierellia bacterium]|nr:nucleotidyl transferase [Tissierellia bacterium]
MSGGIGTRLRPLTCDLPKPMVPIFNKPVMEYGIKLLKKYNIDNIAVTLHYLPNKIIDYFGDGDKFDVKLNYYIEEKPLGTGGSVKNAEDFLDSTIVVISGDAFTNIDLEKAYDFHKEKGSKATLILKREPIPLEYGIVVTDEEGRIIRFLEKPSWGEVFSDTINTGIYILEPEVFDYYKKGENFDFSKDLFPRLLENNVPMYGYITDEYWCDVGDLNSYINTHIDILADKNHHKLIGEKKGESLWIGKGTIIEKGTKIYPPVYIGENTVIKSGAILEPYTVIGDNCFIDQGASIKRSIIWNNVSIGNSCEIRGSVLCDYVKVDERVRIFDSSAIGASAKISKMSTIKPRVKIWPHRTVGENMIISDNLKWEDNASKKLFGYRNICGKLNETITPEVASKLGAAFATIMEKGGTFVVNSDEHSASILIKNSIIAGIMSTGALVIDIKNSTLPMCRFGVKHYKADGGIQVRTDCMDPNTIYLEFVNKNGRNVDKNTERKIENTYILEDFHRCRGHEIKEVVNVYNFCQIYLREGISKIKNREKIASKKPYIVISSPSKNIIDLANTYLKALGCEVRTLEFKRGMNIEAVKNIVLNEDGFIGILYDGDGEKLSLTDGFNIVEDHKYYMLAMLIGFKTGAVKEAIVPYNYPRIMERIAKQYKGKTIYNKSNISELLETIEEKKEDFQYIVSFDSIWATGKILDYLVENDVSLNELVHQLPEYYYFKKEIPCRWDDKGKIIKSLSIDRKEGIELVKGVRFIDDKGWVLIEPDDESPKFNLYIEGHNEEYAEELWIQYNDKINKLMET